MPNEELKKLMIFAYKAGEEHAKDVLSVQDDGPALDIACLGLSAKQQLLVVAIAGASIAAGYVTGFVKGRGIDTNVATEVARELFAEGLL